jgi:tetratricopeptide (TPR) repeat protein
MIKAAAAGIAPNRPSLQYVQGLRRAHAAVQVVPWNADGYTTLALLQYRTGDFEKALLSAERAMNLQKTQSPTAHAIRALAYYGLHDIARAKHELVLGGEPHAEDVLVNAFDLREEAKSLISPKRAPRP